MTHKLVKAKLLEYTKEESDERLLNYVSEQYNAVPYMTADKLCYSAKCSKEELFRFFDSLGVKNMLEFKNLLREIIYSESGGPDDIQGRSLRGIADMVMRYEMSNMAEFSGTLDFELLTRLAQDMLAASEVYLIGLRAGSFLPIYAAHILSIVGIKTIIIDVAANYVDNIANMDRAGLVFAFGFSRYHKSSIALLSMLKRNGYNIVSVTDYPMSPLAQLSNYSLCIPCHSYDYTLSYVSGSMLLNILAAYIGTQDKNALVNRLRQYDEIAQNLEYFF